MKPTAPVRIKAQRQLQWMVIQGTNNGVAMAPTLVPALKIPVARARSFLGNHSATVLMLAGKMPASPKPNEERATTKLVKEWPKACPMDARLQKIIARA